MDYQTLVIDGTLDYDCAAKILGGFVFQIDPNKSTTAFASASVICRGGVPQLEARLKSCEPSGQRLAEARSVATAQLDLAATIVAP